MAAKTTTASKPAAAKTATAAKTPTLATLQTEVKTLQTQVKTLQTAATKHSASKKTKHAAASKAKTGSAKHGTATTTKRGLALPGGIACCAAQGLAASLRLDGKQVSADDVLELFWLTPEADETGATILDTLETAQVHGLAGAYPVFRPADAPADGVIAGITLPYGSHTVTFDRGGVQTWGEWHPVPRSLASAVEEAWEVTWQ